MLNEKGLEWPERLTLRDTKVFADEGQRIFTTATGYGYEKREYVRADLASAPEAPEDVAGVDGLRVQGMVRSIQQWQNFKPEAVAEGSDAQVFYFIRDAKHDMNALWRFAVQTLARAETAEAEASTLRARVAELEADATADDIEAAARGMYGSKWGSPKDDERPGEKMKDVWRKYATDAITGFLARRALRRAKEGT